ncbi:MAG TPA: SRPBCC domain-containing protein, partial [Solirubrobacteraceae bacterium]|nr:SRPBCC domain-containing protein [Solirubrobacteraceae bacterium]
AAVSEQPDRVVRIERTYAASAEEVFDAWTSPEVMRRWFHCGPDWATPVAEVDLRVGGAVRIVMRRPDRREAGARGEYTVIDRPHRLVMTWTFDDAPANQQLVELTFEEAEGTTIVVLTNRDISSDERRASQDEGWRLCLDELERLLGD